MLFLFQLTPSIRLDANHLPHKRHFSSTKPQQTILCRNTQFIAQSREHCIFTCNSRKQHALRTCLAYSSFPTRKSPLVFNNYISGLQPTPHLLCLLVGSRAQNGTGQHRDVTGPFPNCSMFSRDSYPIKPLLSDTFIPCHLLFSTVGSKQSELVSFKRIIP